VSRSVLFSLTLLLTKFKSMARLQIIQKRPVNIRRPDHEIFQLVSDLFFGISCWRLSTRSGFEERPEGYTWCGLARRAASS
jgi:hypothetical protein